MGCLVRSMAIGAVGDLICWIGPSATTLANQTTAGMDIATQNATMLRAIGTWEIVVPRPAKIPRANILCKYIASTSVGKAPPTLARAQTRRVGNYSTTTVFTLADRSARRLQDVPITF